MKQYVYHFKPQGMSGDHLFPLNELKQKQPETFIEQAKKYVGREKLMEKNIPILNCLWNDALHMSPINPQVILDTWRSEGLYESARPPSRMEVYKIPVELLGDGTTVCFQSFNFDFNDYRSDLDQYSLFEKSSFVEQAQVEQKQIEIWKRDLAEGRRLLWYSHTKHILARQSLDVRLLELIVCQ